MQDIQTQLLVSWVYHHKLLHLVHAILCVEHLEKDKMQSKILTQYIWPGLKKSRILVNSCLQCQLMAPKGIPQAPIISLSLLMTPFERTGIDLIGPLLKSASRH